MEKTKLSIIWTILLGVFVFHGVLEQLNIGLSIYDEVVALLCIPFVIFAFCKSPKDSIKKLTSLQKAEWILLLLFLVCGLLGSIINRYQPLWITAKSAVLSIKFFLLMITAGCLQKLFKVSLEDLGVEVQIISFLWFGYYILSLIFKDTLIVPDEWDVCAKAAILLALVLFCKRDNEWVYRICIVCMLTMLVLCKKEKAYGAILILILLYYFIVYRQVKTKFRYIFYLAIPIALLGWNKLYYYYIEGKGKFAKSVMTSTSLLVAKDHFPIGTGFGTFGSNYAMQNYSPVYYLYGIADHPELGVNSKKYLTDLFWPTLLGEAGWLGTIIYVILIVVLFAQIQQVFYYDRKKYFLLIFLLIFVLMTTFTEAGFMQPVIMIYSYVLGTLMEDYQGKRDAKMKYIRGGEE